MTTFVTVGVRVAVSAGLVLLTLYGYRWPIAVWMLLDWLAWEAMALYVKASRASLDRHLKLTEQIIMFIGGKELRGDEARTP